MARICGKRCHNAKTLPCHCWCGGTFHGELGASARADFGTTFQVDKLPTTKELFEELTHPRLFDNLGDGHEMPREAWRKRVDLAVATFNLAREVAKRRGGAGRRGSKT